MRSRRQGMVAAGAMAAGAVGALVAASRRRQRAAAGTAFVAQSRRVRNLQAARLAV